MIAVALNERIKVILLSSFFSYLISDELGHNNV